MDIFDILLLIVSIILIVLVLLQSSKDDINDAFSGGKSELFKNQKSNGFNLEKTKTKNLHAYENLYSLVCLACTWLTIIGADYWIF